MSTSTIPFADLASMAKQIWPEIQDQFLAAVLEARYIGGAEVESFEAAWAEYCQVRHGVGVANGTDALLLTLEALGVGPGDGVVLPANTFIATAEAVVRAGATPQFADVDPQTLLMTPETMRGAVTERTRAVIPVHLFGQPVDIVGICRAAESLGLLVVEDAAQAHGAEWDGRRVGSFGAAACFSFYPGKNLGAFGDAGAVVTNDEGLAERIRSLANHGRPGRSSHYVHESVGTNSRLDTLQAIVLSAKLRHNDEWTAARVAAAGRYQEALAGSPVRLLAVAPQARHVYHLMVARVANRDAVQEALREAGISTGVHYPVPCNQIGPLRQYGSGELPVSEQAATEILSLPMFPHIQDRQIDRVCDVLLHAVSATPVG